MVNKNGKGNYNTTASDSKSLNSTDWKKIGKGAVFAVATSLCTYGLTVLPQLNMGVYTVGIVSILTVAFNAGLKYFNGKN